MPVTVIVGGQFGSEGKGKVSHFLASEMHAAAVVRVGGPNSGHTVIGADGQKHVFRQLPTAALLPDVLCVIPSGAYLDVDVLLAEIERAALEAGRLVIDPRATVIIDEDKLTERRLREIIGSTCSGTGAAVARRIARANGLTLAAEQPALRPFVQPTTPLLRSLLARSERVIIEGTQGFGLSLLHGSHPYVTSRDTTAAGFLSEAGLSPFDADDVVLVLRAFPIRVPGNSGPLPAETEWATITVESGSTHPLMELTSVTQNRRRVARFDPRLVLAAIAANQPTRIVLNHLDYVDASDSVLEAATPKVRHFVEWVEAAIQRRFDFCGISASSLLDRELLTNVDYGHGNGLQGA